MRKIWAPLLTLLVTAGLLSGCLPGQPKPEPVKDPAPAAGTAPKTDGPKQGGSFTSFIINPTSMDPHIYSYGAHIHRMALSEGLVTWKNSKFEVGPASAESWTISPDKLTYTFKLKKGLTWSNGDPLTAKDFEYSLRRAIDPKTWAGASASYQGAGILNAVKFQRSEVPATEVGVKAIDETTLEIKLEKANDNFLMRLAEVWGLPVHQATVEKFGKDWTKPENMVTNGPFKLKSWTVNSEIVMVRNENYKGPNPGNLDQIKLFLNPPSILAYENNEVDSVEVTSADIDRIKANMPNELISSETGAVQGFWLMFGDNQTLMDKRVRQALAMAVDREKIAKVVSKDTVAPANSLFPSVIGGDWSQKYAYKYDVAAAKKLLADAGYPDGKGLPEITLLISYNIAATDPFTMAVIDEWKTNLGVKAKVENLEWGLFSQKRFAYQPADFAGMFNFSWTSPYPDAINYLRGNWGLDTLWADGTKYKEYLEIQNDKNLDAATKSKKMEEFRLQYASPEGKRWMELKAAIDKEPDPAKALPMYQEMAQIRLDAAMYIPMNVAKSFRVVKPHIKGYEMNPFLIGYPMYYRSIWSTK